MDCINVEEDCDYSSGQQVLIFTLSNIYNAEKVLVNILPILRRNVSFTIDVEVKDEKVIVKYGDKKDKERINKLCRMFIEKLDDAMF